MLEMSIESLRVNSGGNQYVVILQQNDSNRGLPIWIGPAEANAIALELQGAKPPRPLTHDLLISVMDNLGASLGSIIVSDIREETFYARLLLNTDSEQLELDSRPSDAMALAVRAKVPIYAEESVLDQAGVLIDSETGNVLPREENESSGSPQEQESLDLSAFRDVVERLDLDQLDRNKRDQGDQGDQGNQNNG